MGHTATIRIERDPSVVDGLLQAMQVEADQGPEGSVLSMRIEGRVLVIDIEAPDLSTLRAALQGTVRLTDAALRVIEGRS